VQAFVKKVDFDFYQNLVEVLIPDVLRPIPSICHLILKPQFFTCIQYSTGSLTQAIRNFAKGLEGWLSSAMTGCPETIMNIKVLLIAFLLILFNTNYDSSFALQLCAVSAFAQTLRRYTSLNHLAQAARAVLQNSTQINQMLADLNRVDFHNVQEQVFAFLIKYIQSTHSHFLRLLGYVSVSQKLCSNLKQTSKKPCSSRIHWNSGPPG